MSKSKSRTEKDSFVEERLVGTEHYKTTISEGSRRVTGRGNTAEDSQRIASDKWQSGKDESGGCLVATACVEARGLPDDCSELNTLRNFRDEYVRKLQNGEQIISEYYKIAPRIIEGINQSGKSKEVYASLYKKLNTALQRVETGKMTLAGVLEEGLGTLEKLKKQFLR